MNKEYHVNNSDLKRWLSNEDYIRYIDCKRIEIMLINIMKHVADLEDKAEIQLYLIEMMDNNSRIMDELEQEVIANRDYERRTLEDAYGIELKSKLGSVYGSIVMNTQEVDEILDD